VSTVHLNLIAKRLLDEKEKPFVGVEEFLTILRKMLFQGVTFFEVISPMSSSEY